MRRVTVAMGVVLCVALAAQGASVVDFEAVNLRPASDGTYSDSSELANQDGMYANTTKSGQKAMYGTRYFNGTNLADVSSISYSFYTFRPDGTGGYEKASKAYSNFSVKQKDGDFTGIFSGSNAASYQNLAYDELPSDVQDAAVGDYATIYAERATISLVPEAGDNLVLQFYEPSNDEAHGHSEYVTVNSSDFVLTGDRTQSYDTGGEADSGIWRGPYEHGIAVLWGDSQSNYLGEAYVWDVQVTLKDGSEFEAGAVPEPLTMLAVGSAVVGLGGYIRRRRRG